MRRSTYNSELQRPQPESMDKTPRVVWSVSQVQAACEEASGAIDLPLVKAGFWNDPRDKNLSLLLDAGPGGFEGGMSSRKYQRLRPTSRATAAVSLSMRPLQACCGRKALVGRPGTTSTWTAEIRNHKAAQHSRRTMGLQRALQGVRATCQPPPVGHHAAAAALGCCQRTKLRGYPIL